ncbi:ATP-binding protein [Haloarchaeobius iranensis]|uniref:Histidine kinase-, DNA gyrase B-, and HSP90-like ATPase n=1 Tax=Haloarchaeobius iranensis TaxID=996166 RepID=A0A1H0BL52_9EURY|nr:ATP-binding protein [Haloarchaeobius iranensis]SDN46389.1 Histidine kinase-, DNA gyrase B-, and HSP90-like ATPase [Haloarchaeobius iranensis]
MSTQSEGDESPGSESPYTMDIETTIVDKLGINLYDRVSAAVAELVANSYDADAEEVEIKLPLNKYLAVHTGDGVKQKGHNVQIVDDGHGMTPEEANELFLRVGRDRRKDGEEESRLKNRPVMGRKGIGKLAPFGICDKVEVLSAGGDPDDDEYEVSHFMMDYNEITDRSKDETDEYRPEPLEHDGETHSNSGTKITLHDFNVKKVPDKDTLERRLGQRFATGTEDFDVKIIDNKDDDPNDEFKLSDTKPPLQEDTEIDLNDKPVEHEGKIYEVSGWMGLAENSYNDEFGGVTIYARGKLASNTRDFGLPAGFTGEFVTRSYLVGEIHADWLDQDDGPDLIQTHRQDILWNSELGTAFSEWGKERVKEVAQSSTEPRRKKAQNKFVEKSGIRDKAAERYDKEGIQEAAVELGKSLGQYANEDELDLDQYLEDLTNFVLQIAPHKHLVDSLSEIRQRAEDGEIDPEDLIELFESTHIAEITSYGQIAQNKVNTIRVLEDRINDYDSDEDDLHEIVESSPWLVDPTWRPLTSEKSISNVREAFEEWYEVERGEPISTTTAVEDLDRKRPDLVMLEIRGSVRVVELKKPGYTFQDEDFERFRNYVTAFEDFFEQNSGFREDFPDEAKLTLIADEKDLNEIYLDSWEQLVDNGKVTGRKSWHDLLNDAKKHHQDFIDAEDQVPDVNEDAFSGISTIESDESED